jgi:hypothetical protein
MATIIKESTSTLGALNASSAVVDISDADVIAVQINGTFVGTMNFYASFDDVTYFQFALHQSTQTSATTDIANTTSTGIWSKPCASLKYFKTIMNAYTSGSATMLVVTSRYGK